MEFEHAERDAEENVESVKEQDVPYAEERLNETPPPHIYNLQREIQREIKARLRYLDG